jgi:hypothetical protein
MDILLSPSPLPEPSLAAPTAHIASTTPIASSVLTAPTASPAPVASLVLTAPIEKSAWLAQHPTVRLTEYCKARKWKTPRPKVLTEQVFYMPREVVTLQALL